MNLWVPLPCKTVWPSKKNGRILQLPTESEKSTCFIFLRLWIAHIPRSPKEAFFNNQLSKIQRISNDKGPHTRMSTCPSFAKWNSECQRWQEVTASQGKQFSKKATQSKCATWRYLCKLFIFPSYRTEGSFQDILSKVLSKGSFEIESYKFIGNFKIQHPALSIQFSTRGIFNHVSSICLSTIDILFLMLTYSYFYDNLTSKITKMKSLT